jgi:hypothetical protein
MAAGIPNAAAKTNITNAVIADVPTTPQRFLTLVLYRPVVW